VSDADLATANNNYITASLQMKAIEKQVITDDQALNDANARLDAAKAKLAQLDAEVDESLKNDTDYQALQTAVVTAQQAVDQAQQQLVQTRQQLADQRSQDSKSRSSSSSPRPR
jgi:predicted  nucleic acid-binding Zn-ribbon protein